VRDVERLGQEQDKGGKTNKSPAREAAEASPDTLALQEKLAMALGTTVVLRHNGERGEIRIHFNGFDQLDDFCRRLCQPQTGR
jgi:ParB family transcriptional regulator, chromosome partitioning protein